jgi:hypothetical protein
MCEPVDVDVSFKLSQVCLNVIVFNTPSVTYLWTEGVLTIMSVLLMSCLVLLSDFRW